MPPESHDRAESDDVEDDPRESPGPSPAGGAPGRDGKGFDPEFIEHYRIRSVVARGGFGTVCRATDTTLDRTVALKIIDDPRGASSLIEEARNTSRLAHPRIAQVYQAGVDDASGLAFIAFEWVDGPTLRALLRGGEMPMRRVLRLAQDIASAVAHAHSMDLIHGDLKADNVVVSGDPGRAKLLDFGLSVTEDEIGEGELWGTPAYMAPELLAGGHRNRESDLFALGVLLYELATGKLPFGGEDGDERAVRARQVEPIPDPRAMRPELPSEIAERITTLLALEPAARTCDAVEVERVIRLRRRSDEGRRLRLPPLLLVLLAAILVWNFRDDLGLGAGANTGSGGSSTSGNREIAAPTPPPTVSLGAWVGRDGVESESSRTVRDLVTLWISGDDPGSALVTESEGATIDGSVRLEAGSGGTGEWVAQWSSLEGDLVEERALGALPLAQEVARALAAGTSNTLATTLEVPEEALLLFVAGVRHTEEGAWRAARESFARARERAGAFPEAAAWEAALWILEGKPAAALSLLETLGDIPTAPGRVLRAVLAVPVRDRSERWGEEHPLAALVDVTLDLHDPTISDASLLAQIRGRDDGTSPPVGEAWWVRERAALAWRTGDLPAMTRALERYRVLLGDARPADLVRLEHARHLAIGPRDEAMATFQDRLFEFAVDDPAYWLKIPFLIQTGRFTPAARTAASLELASEHAFAATIALALDDRLDEAIARSRSIVERYDPSLPQRVRAAIEMLRGDRAAARRLLAEAEQLDPGRIEIALLRAAVDAPPFGDRTEGRPKEGEEGSTLAADTAAGRLAAPFEILSAARRSRLAGDPDSAADSLAALGFVADDLTLFPWPEAIFLGRLERIVALAERGDSIGAEREWTAFRKAWPEGRAPESRISAYATEVEALIEGPPTPRDD